VQLFPADVRFNLTLGKPCEDERLNDVIGRVRATAVVDRLGGLGGTIKHSGSNVSVGEAQLLSMARTLAYDPRVVVLDEATANVDTLTEALLQEATAELLRGRTVFVIAHRLSTIVSADRIVLLDAGRVIEVGSHAALMAKGGAYAALFNEQFVDAGIDAALR
jgi:ABC-type multidrug transport system fused ATPase/permease subunit